jgi:hypothetical protein
MSSNISAICRSIMPPDGLGGTGEFPLWAARNEGVSGSNPLIGSLEIPAEAGVLFSWGVYSDSR